ncbi:MAG TPA: hypothetical protein VGK42_09185 [Candidatus Dormibacteraeota bacterium]
MRRDLATTFVTEAAVIASYLLAFRLVAARLGTTGFGEYSLSRRTISLLLPLGLLGLDVGIARYVSYASVERSARTGSYPTAGLAMAAAGVAVVSAVLLLANQFWAEIFFGSSRYSPLILALPLVLAGAALHGIAYGYLRGLARIQWANVLMAVNYAVVPLLAIVLFGSSAASILVAMGAGWVLVSLVALVRLPVTVKDFGLRIKELARFGIPRVPGDVLQLSLFAAPGILVAHASDIRVAGIVAFGIAALGMIGSGLTPVSFVLLPFAARMFAAGSITKLRIRVLQVAGLTLGTTLVVVILLELFAGTLVSIYLGPSFAAGADVLRLTLIAALPWGVYITLRSVIDAKHVQAINARNMIITFAVFVVATFALRSAVDTVTGPILAFVLSLNVLAALTLFEVYRITRTGDSDRVPTAVEPDFTIG